MTATDPTPNPGRIARGRVAIGRAVLAGAGAIERARFGLWQGAGAVATLAGVYTLIGLGASLIIGGISAIVVSTLREGGRI